jgi:hypothetical protein
MDPLVISSDVSLLRGESERQLVLGRDSQQHMVGTMYLDLDVSEIQASRFHLKS